MYTKCRTQIFNKRKREHTTNDSELINNFYKFYPEGLTKELEQNYKKSTIKKDFLVTPTKVIFPI